MPLSVVCLQSLKIAPHSSDIAADAASRFGARTGLLLIELDSARCAADEYALTREAFAPVLAIVRLEGTAEPFCATPCPLPTSASLAI
jgi:hypothetical protein